MYYTIKNSLLDHTVQDNKLLEVFLDVIHPAALWPGVNSSSNRNGYQEYTP